MFGTDLKSYHNINVGKNINALLKQWTSHGCTIHWKEVNIHNFKHQYAMIVTRVMTMQSLVGSGQVILIDNLEGSNIGRAFNAKTILSNYISLAVMQKN